MPPSDFLAKFDTDKPIVAMVHLPPLPGTPLYDAEAGVAGIVDAVRADLEVLVTAGVDGVLFCNEGDRPYQLTAGPDGVAVMARVVSELAPADRPFGVDFMWDPHAALAVALATGASFIRSVATGAWESDMGLWTTDGARLLRQRRALGADHVSVLMNVTPEFASPLGSRSVAQLTKSTIVSSLADGILVSGPMAGAEAPLEALREAIDVAGGAAPVLVNTGARSTNVADYLGIADGVVVGSDLKRDGDTWAPVDADRVARFLAAARPPVAAS